MKINLIIEKVITLLGWLVGTRGKDDEGAVTEFTAFVKEQLTSLMEQVKTFQTDYIAVCEKINTMYTEMQTLREQLSRAELLKCENTACAKRATKE